MADWDPGDVLGQAPNITELWDPTLGQNVNLQNAGMTAQQYIQANPQTYQGYTGPVAAGNAAVPGSVPVTAQAFTSAPPQPQATTFDPSQYSLAQQMMGLQGVNASVDYKNQWQGSLFGNARLVPGGDPTFGVIPGTGAMYNMITGQPASQSDMDAVTWALGQLTSSNPGAIPTYSQWFQGGGQLSGRGYHLSGAKSPGEQAWEDIFLQTGDPAAAWVIAQARMQRWQENQLSDIQKFAQKYYGPAIMTTVGALTSGGVGSAFGPLAGAAASGAMGAFQSGAMTKWQNPGAIVAGAGGSALGSYGGSALGSALEAGPFVTGALKGGLGGAGGSLGAGAVTGNWNVEDILRAITLGAGGGALEGFMPQGTPENPAANLWGLPASIAGKAGLGLLWPPRRPPLPIPSTAQKPTY